MQFYERIRALREDRDLKQAEIARIPGPSGGPELAQARTQKVIYIFILFCRYVEISTIYKDCLDVAQAIRPAKPGQIKKRG